MKNTIHYMISALILVLSLMSFIEHAWSANLLPWIRFNGTFTTTAGIGSGSLTLNAFVSEMDYENGDVWRSNVPGIETIFGAKIVLSGATRTGNFSFNGDPDNPDDVTISIVSSDGYVYLTSVLTDCVFVPQGTFFVWLNRQLNANDASTLNLHNIKLRPNGDDGAHPSRYISELSKYLGSTYVSGIKIQLFDHPTQNFATNSSGSIIYGLLDGLKTLDNANEIVPPSGLNAVAISSSQINLSWSDNSNNETGFNIERKIGFGGTYTKLANVTADIATYSDTGLAAGLTYYYKVKAYNSNEESNYSNEVYAITLTPPTALTDPATSINGNSVTLNGSVIPNSSDATVYFEWGTTTSYGNITKLQLIENGNSSVGIFSSLTDLFRNTTYHYRLVAINDGGTSYGNDMSFTTPPISLTISSPINGDTVYKPEIMATGTVTNSTGNETGVTVNGMDTTSYSDEFIANHVLLLDGANIIIVSAMDNAGNKAATSVSVNKLTTSPHVTLKANIESGIAPLTAYFSLSEEIPNARAMYQIDFEGDGIIDYSDSVLENISHTYSAEGVYYPTVSVTDDQNNTYMDRIAIVILNSTQLDSLLREKWNSMRMAMENVDVDGAVDYFIDGSKNKYRIIFEALGDQLPAIAGTFIEFNIVNVHENIAEYEVVANENGVLYSYPGIFMKDGNSIWKFKDF